MKNYKEENALLKPIKQTIEDPRAGQGPSESSPNYIEKQVLINGAVYRPEWGP
jgi:hypothetical protein